MDRPTRDELLLETAVLWASRSTCSRLSVGAVIERDGRILVQGYNGAPAGLAHCSHECDCPPPRPRSDLTHISTCPATRPCTRSVHAEQNAISFAARWGVGLEGASVWVTHQPCMSCAQSLINAGIIAVHYINPYRLKDGVNLLEEAGIKVLRHLAFGYPK